MAPPDAPGIPGTRLPSAQEQGRAREPAPRPRSFELESIPPRKDSPPAGIKVQGKGWQVSVPAVALTAILTAAGTLAGSRAVNDQSSSAELRSEMQALREDFKSLRQEFREELREQRSNNRALLTYTRDSVTLLGQTLRELGAKVDSASGPLPPLELHPPPLRGSEAPRVQPRATLPAPPEFGP
jgi:hypothetical protein